ncbi:MAG TPA: hypothetical protein VMI94_14160 [Bryobacteraceae bacterium]|nr:hypothetical protein [Bryobacteraceae bacterium]
MLLLVLGLPVLAHAENCTGLPTSFTGGEFPTGDFFSNFDNSCYTIKMATGYGAVEYADLNARYSQMYFKVDPRYQLILIGTFPNSRYLSVALNDAHSALSVSILDTSIVPLTSQFVNPYLPGNAYVNGQQYAIPINFGGTPGKLETGCMMNGYNVDVNALDGTQRHPGMDWNSDAGLYQQDPTFKAHDVDTPQHTNPNTAGVIMVRDYLYVNTPGYDTLPRIIVRDVASGCAYPAQYALDTLQIVTAQNAKGSPWLDHVQFELHHQYEDNYLQKVCDAHVESPNVLRWTRQPEYIPATNPNASYLTAPVPAGTPDTLAAAGEVMRIRMRVPTAPPTPCTNGCSRSGDEQMRYMSLSFLVPGGKTIASLADTYFTKDAQGYSTLIVGTGATIPTWITSAHGYTYLDLTKLANYKQLSLLDVRHMIPGVGFACAGQFVPYRTSIDTPAGSLIGDYTPVVDYPLASSLPKTATPLTGPSACASFPAGVAAARPDCSVLPEPPLSITGFNTQCQTPGCSEVVAQSNAPIIVTGAGFGNFPGGAPFTGTSNDLRLVDVTRKWSAGYTGDACTVSISSWTDTMIQFVANIGQKGSCSLVAGDTIHVLVWNPQTMTMGQLKATVSSK